MEDTAALKHVLGLFAEVLDYPKPDMATTAQECRDALTAASPEGATQMAEFCRRLERTTPSRLEEVYTSAFDLGSSCHPYVGYHLFGERYERSIFLLELKERFRADRFVDSGNDLPDRLSTLLRFLSVSADEASRQEIIREGILPALDRMLSPGIEGRASPAASPCLMGCGAAMEDNVIAASESESREAAGLSRDPALPAIPAKAGIHARSRRKESLYRHALAALRISLRSTVSQFAEPSCSNPGGKANG